MPGCATPCKAANTCRLWQATPAAWPSQWRCRTTLMCRSLVYCLEGGGPLGGLCVAAARLRCHHRRKIYFGCAGGRHLGGKAVQPARVSFNQALLSGPAVWVLAGPAVRQLSGLALWAQAGPTMRQLSGLAVWAPTGPAVWAPTGPAVWGAAGGLDMVSTITFSLPGMCRMSLVYSAM
jgi:hypothetical protein